MAKKNQTAEGAVSLLEKYQGRTEARGGFAPIWKPKEAGEQVLAEFVKKETVIGQGQGKKKKDDFDAYILKVIEAPLLSLFKSKTIPVDPVVGTIFSVSGDVIGSALKDATPGDKYIIVYQGLGEAKGGNNAPKLFDVHFVKPS